MNVVRMCANDHVCTCHDDVQDGLNTCPDCGAFVCKCGSHDVEVLSRITGYIQPTKGWNAGKLAEFKDRSRYNPFTGALYSHVDGTPNEYK